MRTSLSSTCMSNTNIRTETDEDMCDAAVVVGCRIGLAGAGGNRRRVDVANRGRGPSAAEGRRGPPVKGQPWRAGSRRVRSTAARVRGVQWHGARRVRQVERMDERRLDRRGRAAGRDCSRCRCGKNFSLHGACRQACPARALSRSCVIQDRHDRAPPCCGVPRQDGQQGVRLEKGYPARRHLCPG